MKKILFFQFVLFIYVGFVLFPGSLLSEEASKTKNFAENKKSSSIDIGVGAVLWYTWWEPVWKNNKRIYLLPGGGNANYLEGKYSIEPTFLYGAALSIKLNERLNLAGVFAINPLNRYKVSMQEPVIYLGGPLGGNPSLSSRDVMKYDLDVTLSYLFFKFMKLFTGFKYQGYSYIEKSKGMLPPPFMPILEYKAESTFHCFGPGLGIGFTIPIIASFYILPNVSGIFLFGIENDKSSGIDYTGRYKQKNKTFSAGTKISVSLAYYIQKIQTTVSLGFKFQYLKYIKHENSIYMNDRDLFYGPSFSIVYTF